ncbi:S53 family peptidase [Paludisphaera soli]|uniref:S53 family peptidase n=1 Tax=Paludisphaera soli TaxID=2712865 RepID=UPI0013ED813D|nr:S53 family peptidase [Paludisphaera soli]
MGKHVRGRRLRPLLESLDDRTLPSGFTPSQIAGAYGLSSIALTTPSGETVRGDGTGQTIAIVGAYHNPTLLSDLKVFNDAFRLPEADVTVVSLGGDATDATWASESAMDVQWAHALAPGASILMVEARSDSADDILAAVDVARNTPGVVAVSMSFGFTETAGQHVYDHLFTTPAGRAGITFIAASGDHGPEGGAMYPASSPNVLGVGGTSLTLDAAGAVQSEAVWSGSGSGQARFAARPSFQQTFQQGARRSTPDVSFLGDPSTGVSVFHTRPGESQGDWRVVAGTSLGAPAWAAVVAIVAQGRELNGQGSLDGPSQTLPMLYALAGKGFRGVANPVSATAAGLGVPNGQALIPAMVQGSSVAPAVRTDLPSPALPAKGPTIRRPPAFRRERVAPTPPVRVVRQPIRAPRQAAAIRRAGVRA